MAAFRWERVKPVLESARTFRPLFWSKSWRNTCIMIYISGTDPVIGQADHTTESSSVVQKTHTFNEHVPFVR